jgi:hypothetical protein
MSAEEIAKSFCSHYYQTFDTTPANLRPLFVRLIDQTSPLPCLGLVVLNDEDWNYIEHLHVDALLSFVTHSVILSFVFPLTSLLLVDPAIYDDI